MNDKNAAREVEVEGLEMIDLGDATKETRDWHPMQIVQDTPTTWGLPFAE